MLKGENKMFKQKNNISELVKDARKKNKLSARKLAELCDVSHTEINNIESGVRIKPALLTLKGFEKYLGLSFKDTAKMVGYSDETIKYGEKNIIVSYEMYDKVVEGYKEEQKHMLFKLDQKRHLALDTKEAFSEIHKYLNEQENIDKELLDKADSIDRYLTEIERKYESINKEN